MACSFGPTAIRTGSSTDPDRFLDLIGLLDLPAVLLVSHAPPISLGWHRPLDE